MRDNKPKSCKLKAMNSTEPKPCESCGGTRFKRYSELNPDERILAEGRKGDRPVENEDGKENRVCLRCFSMDRTEIGGEFRA